MKRALEIHNLTVSYDKKPVLWDIDFEIPEGQIIGIIGPNGSGKTTLLKAIMEIIPADSGYTRIFEKPLKEVRHRVSYVPQRQSVDWDFPASVLDICLMGRYNKARLIGKMKKADVEIAKQALERVGLAEFAKRQISQLSGGQQQRVFIARSLAQKADIYFMDEPFVGVDAASEESILNLLLEMKKEGKTVVIVHHDLHTAMEYFDWMVLLNTRLIVSGPIDEVFTEPYLREAYGGKLTILSQITDLVKNKNFPVREKRVKK